MSGLHFETTLLMENIDRIWMYKKDLARADAFVSQIWRICRVCEKIGKAAAGPDQIKVCSVCCDAFYCSVECQTNDWPGPFTGHGVSRR